MNVCYSHKKKNKLIHSYKYMYLLILKCFITIQFHFTLAKHFLNFYTSTIKLIYYFFSFKQTRTKKILKTLKNEQESGRIVIISFLLLKDFLNFVLTKINNNGKNFPFSSTLKTKITGLLLPLLLLLVQNYCAPLSFPHTTHTNTYTETQYYESSYF